jgi:hypothetical protein
MKLSMKIIMGVLFIAGIVFFINQSNTHKEEISNCVKRIDPTGIDLNFSLESCEAIIKLKKGVDESFKKRKKLLLSFCKYGNAKYYDEGVPKIEIKDGIAHDLYLKTKIDCKSGDLL